MIYKYICIGFQLTINHVNVRIRQVTVKDGVLMVLVHWTRHLLQGSIFTKWILLITMTLLKLHRIMYTEGEATSLLQLCKLASSFYFDFTLIKCEKSLLVLFYYLFIKLEIQNVSFLLNISSLRGLMMENMQDFTWVAIKYIGISEPGQPFQSQFVLYLALWTSLRNKVDAVRL